MKQKLISSIICTIILTLCVACGSDKEDEPQGLYDWEITKTIYDANTSTKVEGWNEYLEDKSEEYVLNEKRQFESQSTQFYKYKYAYRKMN